MLLKAFLNAVLFTALTFTLNQSQAQCWPQSGKLIPEKASNNTESFGHAIDFSGNFAVVGAPQSDTARTSSGVVYVFEFDGAAWNKVASLAPSDHKLYHNFGLEVKFVGDHILVGDPTHEIDAVRVGAIYMFEKPAEGWHDMVQTSIITSSDSRCRNLGSSLDVHDNTVLAGAPYSLNNTGENSGAAYIFELQAGGLVEIARLSTSHTLSSRFGSAVALRNNIAVVAASEETEATHTRAGSVYVFEKSTASPWTNLLPTARLTTDAPDGSTWPLANSVAIDESRNTVFVTNYFYGGEDDIHAEIRVYKKPAAGWQDKVQDFVHQYDGHYLQTMTFDEPFLYFSTENSIAIAAPGLSGEWESLEPIASLTASDFNAQMNFGSALVAKEGRVMAGAPGGITLDREQLILPVSPSVYEFEIPNSGWAPGSYQELRKFNYMPRTSTDFTFGYQIDIDGDFAVVGAPHDNYGGKAAGAVYVYQLVDLAWQKIATLSPSDGEPNDFFGGSIAISKNFIAVGAVNKHYRDQSGKIVDHNLGSVYIFERPASGWTDMSESYKLVKTDNYLDYTDEDRIDDSFGVTLDMDYPTLVIAKYDRYSRPNTGSVYVYDLSSGDPVLEATLDPSIRSSVNDFGSSIRIQNNTIAIGTGPLRFWFIEANIVFVYVKPGDKWQSGTESATLQPSDISYGAAFGYSIDITHDASKIIVGAPGWFKEGSMAYSGDYFKGAAYIYERPPSGWQDNINEKARLIINEQQNYACMGISVYIEDRYAAIGSPQNYITTAGGDNAGTGRVYVYQMPDSGWTEKQPDKIIEGDETGNPEPDYFGSSVKGVLGYLLVGAIADDNQNSVDAGAVYVYTEYPFIFPGQSPVCESHEPITLSAFPAGGEWSGEGLIDPSNGIFDPNLAGEGIHRVKYRVDDCDASNALVIDVRKVLTSFSLSDSDSLFFCGSSEKTLIAPSGNGYRYTWDFSVDGENFTGVTNAILNDLTVREEGFYRANITNDCSTAADTIWIGNLYPLAGEDFQICMTDELQNLEGNYPQGIWTGSGITNNNQFSSQDAGKGLHELIYAVSPVDGCIYRDTLLINVKGILELNIYAIGETSFCYTGETLLHATNLADVTYQWFFRSGNEDFNELPIANNILKATELGIYRVVVSDGLCEREESYQLKPSPFTVEVKPAFDSISFCYNAPIQIVADPIPGAAYRWISVDSDGSPQVEKSSFDVFTTRINESGTFYLEVNHHGCSFTSHVMSASQIPDDSVFVPNVITPNNDGLNDQLEVHTQGVEAYSLRILNRYGTELFQSAGGPEPWNGEQSSGVYFWLLTYFSTCENRTVEFKGTVHVLR